MRAGDRRLLALRDNHAVSLHRCPHRDCDYFGQPTDRGCRCHISDEQVLREQIGEMLEALWQYESDLNFPPTGDSRWRRLERVRRVIAKATPFAASDARGPASSSTASDVDAVAGKGEQ